MRRVVSCTFINLNQYLNLLRIFLSSLFITFLLLFNSCGNERVGCNGQIIIENTIPDTTLSVGQHFVRDLSKQPKVFSQTENQDITIQDVKGDINIVSIHLEESQNTGDLDVLNIDAKSVGETTIEINAIDSCPDGGETTTFNVTVIDTTN